MQLGKSVLNLLVERGIDLLNFCFALAAEFRQARFNGQANRFLLSAPIGLFSDCASHVREFLRHLLGEDPRLRLKSR